MAVLSRNDILEASLATEELHVPELGGTVLVKALSAKDRNHFSYPFASEDKAVVRSNTLNMHARLASLCLVDESGARLFKDNDVPKLEKVSAAALQRIFEKARELSGMADNTDEIAGNSKGPAGPTSTS